MKNLYIGLGLFLTQILLTFQGVVYFGKYASPFLFFGVSFAIALYFLWLSLQKKDTESSQEAFNPIKSALGALLGVFSIVLSYEEFRKLLVKFTPPRDYSDVLPQMETMYQRFSNGEFPYASVDMGSWSPYPVYMPLHWMPVGIAQELGMDTRWIGFIFLAIAAGIYGWFTMRTKRPALQQVLAILLPSIALWGYILWGGADLPVSFELVVGAYYLVLAAGLMSRDIGWITAGLILCLLSRYTLVFWLPLFALLLWQHRPPRENIPLWLSVAGSIILLYILPFYAKDPTIFSKGIAYHNQAVVDEWKGYGEPAVSHTMERGIHFALQLKAWFSGEMVERVYKTRVLQGAVMLLLLALGWLGWRRWRHRLQYFEYSLLMLYCFILFFYCFGPLTYRYYLLVLHIISAVLCGRIVLQSRLSVDAGG